MNDKVKEAIRSEAARNMGDIPLLGEPHREVNAAMDQYGLDEVTATRLVLNSLYADFSSNDAPEVLAPNSGPPYLYRGLISELPKHLQERYQRANKPATLRSYLNARKIRIDSAEIKASIRFGCRWYSNAFSKLREERWGGRTEMDWAWAASDDSVIRKQMEERADAQLKAMTDNFNDGKYDASMQAMQDWILAWEGYTPTPTHVDRYLTGVHEIMLRGVDCQGRPHRPSKMNEGVQRVRTERMELRYA